MKDSAGDGSVACAGTLPSRISADQPSMFAPVGSFYVRNFSDFDLKVVAQVPANCFFYLRQPGTVKLRAGDIPKLDKSQLLLVELEEVKPIQTVIMHIESS